jgi:hypothetical protein
VKRNHRRIVICCAAGVLVLACLFAGMRLSRSRPPQPQDATPEQTARLDAIIDQLQEARQSNQGTKTSSTERLNLVLQYLDPHTRARIRKHIPALLVRMQERGIQAAYPF